MLTIKPEPTPPEIAEVTEIGIARRARAAENEVGRLRERVAALEAERGAARLEIEKGQHGATCVALVDGGGRHPVVMLNEESRTARCKVCGAVLDPYEILLEYANSERRFAYQLEHRREEARDLRKEVDDLRAAKKNLRRRRQDDKANSAPPTPVELRLLAAALISGIGAHVRVDNPTWLRLAELAWQRGAR